jgi:hypothetical protein
MHGYKLVSHHLLESEDYCSLLFHTYLMKSTCPTALIILLGVLFSCSKDSKDPDVPDNRPLQLIKKVTRYEYNGQVMTDSIAYTYDTAGHLTAKVDPKTNLPYEKLVYAGDTLVAVIDFLKNGTTDTLKRPVKFFDGGNTIFIDFTRPNPNGGIDTVQITYKWSGDQLLEAWTYLHLAYQGMNFLQKTLISYNSSGNQYETTTLVPGIGPSQWQSRGLAYDQNKNFFRTLSRLNYIFMGWGFPEATRSVNNPVKGEYQNGQVEYLWTYNKDGYPLTMQVKGKNYLAVELQYNK